MIFQSGERTSGTLEILRCGYENVGEQVATLRRACVRCGACPLQGRLQRSSPICNDDEDGSRVPIKVTSAFGTENGGVSRVLVSQPQLCESDLESRFNAGEAS